MTNPISTINFHAVDNIAARVVKDKHGVWMEFTSGFSKINIFVADLDVVELIARGLLDQCRYLTHGQADTEAK